jgi:hypothetical protein
MICVLCCKIRIHVITCISGHVCDVLCVNASILITRKDLGWTNHPCLRVGRNNPESPALDFLQQKQQMIKKLKENLAQAQARIKKIIDKKRSEREFKEGDMVYLKFQPFRHNAFGLYQNLKLTTKYYGPFKILEKIGTAV